MRFGVRFDQKCCYLGLLVMLLGLCACSDDGGPLPEPPPLTGVESVPAAVTKALDAHVALARRLALAMEDEEAGIEARREELATSADALAKQVVELGCRPAFLKLLKGRLEKRADRSVRNAVDRRVAEDLLVLFRRLDGDSDYDFYRRILTGDEVDAFLRHIAADAMASRDVLRAQGDFLAVIRAHEGRRLGWQGQLVAILRKYGSPELAAFLVEILGSDEDEQVLLKVAFEARHVPDARLLEPLKQAASTSASHWVRVNAAQSLAKLVGRPCIPFLRRLKLDLPPGLTPEQKTVLEQGLMHAELEAGQAGMGPLGARWKP